MEAALIALAWSGAGLCLALGLLAVVVAWRLS